MRIHSSILARSDFTTAVRDAGLPDVWVSVLVEHGSRARRIAYEVSLSADPATHARKRNSGTHGTLRDDYGNGHAATYDEHGRWMAELLRIDPDAIVGPYKGIARFREMTNARYGPPEWRQTSCRHCGHDVEGQLYPDLKEWRDRGSNNECGTYEGRDEYGDRALITPPVGQRHAPYLD